MTAHSARVRRFAEAIGPREAAALAATIPSLETDGLVRILSSTRMPNTSDPARD